MADADTPAASGSFGFLTHKLGPLPVWMWGLIIVAAGYWYLHFGPGASSAQTATTTTTDSGADSSQPSFSPSAYKTNAEWEGAALNYLVGESVPPDEASNALFKYLHSQTLSPQEQGDVNLAIEGIGPPPSIPAPSAVSAPATGSTAPGTQKTRPVPIKNAPVSGIPLKPTPVTAPSKGKPVNGKPVGPTPKPKPPAKPAPPVKRPVNH